MAPCSITTNCWSSFYIFFIPLLNVKSIKELSCYKGYFRCMEGEYLTNDSVNLYGRTDNQWKNNLFEWVYSSWRFWMKTTCIYIKGWDDSGLLTDLSRLVCRELQSYVWGGVINIKKWYREMMSCSFLQESQVQVLQMTLNRLRQPLWLFPISLSAKGPVALVVT